MAEQDKFTDNGTIHEITVERLKKESLNRFHPVSLMTFGSTWLFLILKVIHFLFYDAFFLGVLLYSLRICFIWTLNHKPCQRISFWSFSFRDFNSFFPIFASCTCSSFIEMITQRHHVLILQHEDLIILFSFCSILIQGNQPWWGSLSL